MLKANYLKVLNAVYDIIERDIPILLYNRINAYEFINDEEFIELFKIINILYENNLIEDLLKTTFSLLDYHMRDSLLEYKKTQIAILHYREKQIIPILGKDLNRMIYTNLKNEYIEGLNIVEYKYFRKTHYLSRLFKYLDIYYLPYKSTEPNIIYERGHIKIFAEKNMSNMFKSLWQIIKKSYNL